jgi:hypothetical protein
MRLLILLLLSCCLLHADTLTDLKQKLAKLDGATPVAAKVDYEISNEDREDDQTTQTQGRASAQVEDGPAGITITWARELINQSEEAAKEQSEARERKSGARRALGGIGPMMVRDHLNAAPGLLRMLNQAELLEEKRDTWEGQPVTLLVLKLNPQLNAQARKYIKELKLTGRLWLGADGLPLAAETRQFRKGRAMLVISFEATDTEAFRYATVGDRLVTLLHTKANSGSGAGHRTQTKDTTTIQLQPKGDST